MPPSIRVDGGAAGVKASVSAASAVTATLDSTDGVRQCAWSVYSTDETSAAASYTLVQTGSVGQNVAFTSLGQGTAMILQVVINAGVNQATGLSDVTATQARVKVYVPLADGGEVGCAGEEFESDATFGTTGLINAGIRKAALLSPSGVPVKIVRLATTAALPANTRTGNVLTADANGALAAQDGVTPAAGDRLLVQNEGGGASHVNNGCYSVTDAGDAGSPFVLTRTTDFDDTDELIAMTTFRVQEGTTYAGTERYLVTSGATINVTALEFASFAYAPVAAQYLCRTANALLSGETACDAITSTVTFASTSVIPLGASRTSSTTADVVDVAEVTALSSGTAAAGFGPTIKFLGEVSGGGAENYGRVGFQATDLTGSSEDTKAVVQARTAGAAMASCAEFSGTAVRLYPYGAGRALFDANGTITSTAITAAEVLTGLAAAAGDIAVNGQQITGLADGVDNGDAVNVGQMNTAIAAAGGGLDELTAVLENASTALNANGVPIQDLAATLTFTSSAALPLASARVDSATNTVVDVEQLSVNTSGTAATNYGIGKLWKAEDAGGGAAAEIGREAFRWTTATALSATSQYAIYLRQAGDGLAIKMTLDGDGMLTVADLTLSSLGTGYLYATSGVVSIGATQPAPSDAAFLTNGAVAGLSAEVNVQAITSTIGFASTTTIPISLTRDAATTDSVLDLLTLTRTTSDAGFGNAGIGAGIAMYAENDAGAPTFAGRISATLTDPADGSENSSIVFDLNVGGSNVPMAAITATALTMDGVIQSFGSGFVGVSLDRADAGALTIAGTNATSVLIPEDTTIQQDGLGAVSAAGLTLLNDTATDGVTTEQRPPFLYWKGHGRATSGGTDVPVEVRVGPVLTAGSSNPTVDIYFQRQLAGGGWLTYGYLTSSLPSLGGSGWYSINSILLGSGSNGYRLDQGSSNLGGLKVSSTHVVVESQGAAKRVEIWDALATGSTDDGVRIWNNAGTRSAGNLLAVGDGGSYTQKWAVGFDGRTTTTRVVSAPDVVTSSASAMAIRFDVAQNFEHTTTEASTVSLSGATVGQSGEIVFLQGATGYTITMPSASATVKYTAAMQALGTTAMVDTTATYTTIIKYYIQTGGIVLFHGREVFPV